MQLSDFRIPFDWEGRKPALLEKCLYVPDHYEGHEQLTISWGDVFAKKQPLQVEFCCGNGQWVTLMAQKMPEYNWIAVDRDFDRARKTWLKIFRNHLSNLFVVYGDGLTFSKYYLPPAAVRGVFVNFPDPWPNRRHAKHRIIQRSFVDEMKRILEPGSPATVVTDDAAYSEVIVKEFASWKSAFAPAPYITEWPDFGPSYFYSLWVQKQRTIRYHQFVCHE